MGFKICSESDDEGSGNPVTRPEDDGEDAGNYKQESSGSATYIKWILIGIFVLCGATSHNAPIGGIVLFVGLLLTHTGSEHQGGNDARKK